MQTEEQLAKNAVAAWLWSQARSEAEIQRRVREYEARLRAETAGEAEELRLQAASLLEAAHQAGSTLWLVSGLDIQHGETISLEYVCPDCGSPVTTGLLGEEYDDWRIMPHCANHACGRQATSEKSPFDSFIEATPEPE